MQERDSQCHDGTAACSSPPEEFGQVRPPGGIKHKGTSPLHFCQLVACTESFQASACSVQKAAGITSQAAMVPP